MGKRKTHEQFIKEFNKKNSNANNIEILGKYQGSKKTILCKGNYHDGTVNKEVQSDEKFNRQQEHDKRKREYAKKNNIKLLEIWYWDFDNIEGMFKRELNL